MYRRTALLLIFAFVGCSKSTTEGGSAKATAPSATSVTTVSGNACDRKLLTTSDLSTILKGTVTMGPLQGDPQSCVFKAGYDSVTVSLRPGLGDTSVKMTLSGATNVTAVPLSGVGDKAAWTPILREVNATKNNLLCDLQPNGPGNTGATEQALGALCNKIFSAF